MKNLITEIEKSWKIIFEEFNSNVNKDIVESKTESKLHKLVYSWKNIIKESMNKENFSVQSFSLKEITEDDISVISNHFLKKIQNQNYFKMYEEIEKFLNINYEIIKTVRSYSCANMECSKDFVQILFILSNFKKSLDFDEIWYLKIIFKELYSLLDKYSIFFSISCSLKGFDDKKNNSTGDKHLEFFQSKIFDKGINKYNYVIIEDYDSSNKTIFFRVISNKSIKNIENDKSWIKVSANRNKFEHFFLDSVLKGINEVVLDDLKNCVYYLIGMNIWLLTILDQQFKDMFNWKNLLEENQKLKL